MDRFEYQWETEKVPKESGDMHQVSDGENIMLQLSKPHVHKNFTLIGLISYYIAGLFIFSAIYLISFDIHWYWYKKDRKRMNMFMYTVRFVRMVHAVIATLVAIPIMLYTTDFIADRYLILDIFVALSGGYLTFDLLGRYNEHLQVYEPPGKIVSYNILRRYVWKQRLLITHHLVLVLVVYPVVLFSRDEQGDFLVACVLFTELSTPIREMQWLMEHTLTPLNTRYVVVSMVNLATTFVCRILIIPFIYEALAEHTGRSITDLIFTMGPWWHLLAVSYFIPNTFWLLQNIVKITVYLNTRHSEHDTTRHGRPASSVKID